MLKTFRQVVVAGALLAAATASVVLVHNAAARPDPLAEVNACLKRFDTVMYRGVDGRHRIYGDINRIQDIVDSNCSATFPENARKDLDTFFAEEVDVRIAKCLRRVGVDAEVDLSSGQIGIEIRGPASRKQLDSCFGGTYDWYRHPPSKRPPDPGT